MANGKAIRKASKKAKPNPRGGPRKDIDWEKVGLDYRTGRFTNADLGEKYGVSENTIHARAKKHGWKKDMTAAVQNATNAAAIEDKAQDYAKKLGRKLGKKLVEGEKSAIELAAAENVLVLREHKGIAQNMRDLSTRLFGELAALTGEPKKLDDLITMVAGNDPLVTKELIKAVSLPSRIASAKDLAATAKILIEIERKAHGLEDQPPPPPPKQGGVLDPEEIAEIRRLEKLYGGS